MGYASVVIAKHDLNHLFEQHLAALAWQGIAGLYDLFILYGFSTEVDPDHFYCY